MRLSPHFRSEEFDCHDGTRVPAAMLSHYKRLCRHFLEPLRTEFGPVVVVSGFRTKAHNREVGGAPRSMHLWHNGQRGAGADVTCSRGSPGEWYAYLNRLGPGGLGRYVDHVHVDTRRGPARW